MAQVHPFCGWRYDVSQVGDLSDVTCPPYDVIDAEFQERLYDLHPCNVVRLELNRDEPGDTDPDEKYRRAAEFLRRWMHQGVLLQEREDALYVYHQVFTWAGQTYTRRGFLGRIRLERFGEGKVFPHEQTMSGPKADRLKLLEACQMNLSPVFGLFPDKDNAVQSPLEKAVLGITALEATDHLGVVHRLWPVSEHSVVDPVRRAMWDKPVFIADGHHRYETAINYRDGLQSAGKLNGPEAPANFALMMFVGMSDPGLIILPTHRLVSNLPPLTATQIKTALAPNFSVETIGTGPTAARETWELIDAAGRQGILGFGTTSDGEWLLARLTDGSPMRDLAPDQSDDWHGLGVSLLHKLVIEHLLKPFHQAQPPQCRYVHQLEEVEAAQKANEVPLACLVPPAQIEHVEQIAARLEKMPPKSTYFYPKLQTGLVFNPV
ncbi:MAG: DUF1015 domain-containing protein [Planctomycetaceae bacterium]|nr:DUF1015 domain-containing protein [Planctomycetaceae bacterium]